MGNILTALSRTFKDLLNIRKKDIDSGLQAVAKSTRSRSANYLSVQTLDPVRLGSAFSVADNGDIADQATLFELVEEHDPHIFSELSKRRRAVTGLGWQLRAPRDASQSELDRTAELQDMLADIPGIEDALYDVTDAIGKGFCALEIDWGKGDVWLPRRLIFVPQHDFRVDIRNGDFLYLNNGIPEPLKPAVWCIHQHKAKSGYIEQAALFRVLAWTYAYKAYNVMDMQRFLETYGMPLRLGKYPDGITEKQRNELLRAVRNIGYDGAGIISTQMSIDFIEAKNTGRVDDFLSAVEYWERKQSLAILGGTLTSQADGRTSTNALGLVHDKVRREIMLHDARQIEPSITRELLAKIVAINGMFPVDRMPVFRFDTAEPVDQEKAVKILTDGVRLGMEIDIEYAHELLQIPRAGKDAKLLTASQIGMATDTASLSRAALSVTKADHSVDALADKLANEATMHEQAIIQQIYACIAESGDYDEAIAKIEQLNIDLSAFATLIGQGMAAADLAGRVKVEDKV